MNNYQFSIGADPEIFVAQQGKFISAHGLVDGDKLNPLKVDRGAVQVDGMALEFNTDPAEDKEGFMTNLQTVQDQLKAMIGDREFLTQASVTFDEEFLKDVPFENLMLGCMPDFDAYEQCPNNPPNDQEMMRTAGGHVHIGGFSVKDEYTMEHMDLSARLARSMDRHLGVYSLLWDHDDKRRGLYGKAGAFRPKTYGMEYRTLSNAWIFNKKIVEFVFEQTKKAVDFVLDGNDVDTSYRDIINSSDRSAKFFSTDETALQLKGVLND